MKNYRIFVEKHPRFRVEAESLRRELNANLNLDIRELRLLNVYDLFGFSEELLEKTRYSVFGEVVTDSVTDACDLAGQKYIAVEYLPGQFDQRAASAVDCVRLIDPSAEVRIRSSKLLLFDGAVTDEEIARIKRYHINAVESREKDLSVLSDMEQAEVKPVGVLEGFREMADSELEPYCKTMGLAMNADDLREELAADLEEIDAECARQIESLKEQGNPENFDEFSDEEPLTPEEIASGIVDIEEECKDEKQLRTDAFNAFMKLSERDLISDEPLFREMTRYYSMYFKGGMGAEAVRDLLAAIDLPSEAEKLKAIIADEDSQKQKREKAVKRLEVVDAFLKGGNSPANMILDVIPVIPPDLRPMVQLDGGRFAASDLNDLYRRVINRNNRLKRLLDLDAPAIIVNNEKRMLQESVDALFDNGRRGRPVSGRGGRPLKSLAEALKGKQGRFRQNLLGKRVDYSGRSVIVTDPKLLLHQCGLPKTMALELFKPFVMKRLVELGKVENIKGAKRAIDRGATFVWDILEEVIDGRVVLLNRAPTLHRLSIQAFEPVLVEGKAIHLHPLVCSPFNADFDGDQMSVHVPLSSQAQAEARVLMLSANNLRSPASGKPVNIPSQDMIIGVYYLTQVRDGLPGENHVFASFDDALHAYDCRSEVDMQAKIQVRVSAADANVINEDGTRIFRVKNGKNEFVDYDVTGNKTARFETSIGRIIFNRQCLPEDYEFMNYKMVKGDVAKLVADCCDRYPEAKVGPILDAIKYSGFHYATRAGLTISVWDALIPAEKQELLDRAQANVDQINEYFEEGFINETERHIEVVNEWTACTDKVAALMLDLFDEENPLYMMADSGARGSKTQLRQLGGMRGLMADMSGETIDLPIKANFREGLLPLEYFISTYGARKGLVDTASHTSDSGYLTRRLVDVAQDVIVREEDCGTHEGVTYNLIIPGTTDLNTDLVGRCFIEDVVAPDGTVLFEQDGYIEKVADIQKMVDAGLKKVKLRALLTCRSKYGVCQKCYGWDLSTRRPVAIGTAVGIIAAQSIGEPGTQLTMRTFHTGGLAGGDITQGLPRVEELFEARKPKRMATLAEIGGTVKFEETSKGSLVNIVITAPDGDTRTYAVPHTGLLVKDGDVIEAGHQLTYGALNPHEVLRIRGADAVYNYLIQEVLRVYRQQGVDINDKHIEIIVRQMMRKVRLEDAGDTKLLDGSMVDVLELDDANEEIDRRNAAGERQENGEPLRHAVGTQLLMGITKASLATDSFLSAASFQETTKVLTEAAIKGKADHLVGLKENVIIGKLIPAGTGLTAYHTFAEELVPGPAPVEAAPEPIPAEL